MPKPTPTRRHSSASFVAPAHCRRLRAHRGVRRPAQRADPRRRIRRATRLARRAHRQRRGGRVRRAHARAGLRDVLSAPGVPLSHELRRARRRVRDGRAPQARREHALRLPDQRAHGVLLRPPRRFIGHAAALRNPRAAVLLARGCARLARGLGTSVLRDRGLRGRRFRARRLADARPGLHEGLRREASRPDVVRDGMPIVDQLRARKSPAELALLQQGGRDQLRRPSRRDAHGEPAARVRTPRRARVHLHEARRRAPRRTARSSARA